MAKTKQASTPAKSAKNAAAALQGTPNVPAVQGPGTKLALPAAFKPVRALQLPTLVLKVPNEGRALGFLSGLRISSVAPKKEGEGFATVAHVVDLETGEEMQFLVPSVVESTLCDNYCTKSHGRPERTDNAARQAQYDDCHITGMTFYIRNEGKKKPTQRHVDFTVIAGESMSMSPDAG